MLMRHALVLLGLLGLSDGARAADFHIEEMSKGVDGFSATAMHSRLGFPQSSPSKA